LRTVLQTVFGIKKEEVMGGMRKIKKIVSAISPYVIQTVFFIMLLRVAAVMVAYHIGSLGLLGI
jgi:hypothetical protein